MTQPHEEKDPQTDELSQLLKHFLDEQQELKKKDLEFRHNLSKADQFLSSREFIWVMLALTMSISLCIVGYVAFDLHQKKKAHEAAIRYETQQKKEEITTRVSNAILDMMLLRETILLECGASEEKKRQFQHERLQKRYDFLRASSPAVHSIDYQKMIEDFFDWEKSITDYCQPTAPSKEEWERRLTEIESKMRTIPF